MPFTIRSRDLNQAAINAIQERFGDVNLVIDVKPNNNKNKLAEKKCWALIDKLDWADENKNEQIVDPLITSLASGNIAHIYQFADWLAKKLWQLDSPVYAKKMIKQDGNLSVDDFLYARCAVVANGKKYYDLVLNHPEQFPISVTFLPLLHTPLIAYQRKTKEEMVYIPMYNYETYGNKKAWGK